MKKNKALIALLLVTIMCNTFGMEPENKNDKPKWLTLAANSLLHSTTLSERYNTQALEQFLFQDVDFENLPLRERTRTIIFLTNNLNASDLKSAASAIDSLTKVNKQLDTLINAPTFSLQLIKHLAQQFNCSDEMVTQTLQSKEAQNRLSIQKIFKKLFVQWDFDQEEFDNLYDQYKDYVDLNFTYNHPDHLIYDHKNRLRIINNLKNTLLIDSAMYNSPYKALKMEDLLKTDKVNINYQNALNRTALIACAYTCDNPHVLQLLCKTPNICIDLQDELGNTALMAACLSNENKNLQKGCIFTLLYAGANPEIANKKKQTPLTVNKDVQLLQDAIQHRHPERVRVIEEQPAVPTQQIKAKQPRKRSQSSLQ